MKREGEISRQSVEAHRDIVRENDQLLHEPENASEGTMSDTQESITQRVRLLVRTKSALKLDVTCERSSFHDVKTAVQRAGAEVLQSEPEHFAKEIEQALAIDGHETISQLQFVMPGSTGRMILYTPTPTEEEAVKLFEAAGWTIFEVSRDVAY
jgi:hypothetical protein